VNEADDGTTPLQIMTHIRARGDMNFTDSPWAGRVAPGLWVESFSLRPLKNLSAHDIEYKGLTGTGFETPWLSDDQNCGTKGMSVPLVGFAVRLKPNPETTSYDCEYSGYFQSGTVIGPLRNGAPCRSTVANDPLEGIQSPYERATAPAVSRRTVTGRRGRAADSWSRLPPPASIARARHPQSPQPTCWKPGSAAISRRDDRKVISPRSAFGQDLARNSAAELRSRLRGRAEPRAAGEDEPRR
jgi:hypothetical protein